jgi:hypothetical protein
LELSDRVSKAVWFCAPAGKKNQTKIVVIITTIGKITKKIVSLLFRGFLAVSEVARNFFIQPIIPHPISGAI